MAETLKQKIIKALIESLKIPQKDLDDAIIWHEERGVGLDRALIEKGLIKEEDMLASLVKELRIPFINLKKYKISPALKELISEKVARQYRIIPISRLKDMITVAISDPFNIFVMDDLKSITGHDIDVVMSTESDILEAIDEYYGSDLISSVKDVTKDIDLGDFEILEDRGINEDIDIGADEADQAPIEGKSERRAGPHQDHVAPGYHGDTHASGRAVQDAHFRQGDRFSRVHASDDIWPEGRPARSGQTESGDRPGRFGIF